MARPLSPTALRKRVFALVPEDTVDAVGEDGQGNVRLELDKVLASGRYEAPDDESPPKRVGLYVSKEQDAALDELAERTGVIQSKWVRLAFHRAAYGKAGGK